MIQLFYIFSDWAIVVLRLAVAVIFLAHGWPKIKDLKTTAINFNTMGFKPGRFWGTLVAVVEFFGALFLIFGLFTQIAALLLAVNMSVAMIWKIKNGMKLVGGYELDIILLVALLVLAAMGSSIFSLDNVFRIYLF